MMAHLHMRPSEPKPFNQPVSTRTISLNPTYPPHLYPLTTRLCCHPTTKFSLSVIFFFLSSCVLHSLLIPVLLAIYAPYWPVSINVLVINQRLLFLLIVLFSFTKHFFIKFITTCCVTVNRSLCFNNVPVNQIVVNSNYLNSSTSHLCTQHWKITISSPVMRENLKLYFQRVSTKGIEIRFVRMRPCVLVRLLLVI